MRDTMPLARNLVVHRHVKRVDRPVVIFLLMMHRRIVPVLTFPRVHLVNPLTDECWVGRRGR
jgi:hypothetical protein